MGGNGSVTDTEVAPSAETRAPMLAVRDGARAGAFYVDAPDGAVVARLVVGDAVFWLADGSPKLGNPGPASLGGTTVRLLLILAAPTHRPPARAVARRP